MRRNKKGTHTGKPIQMSFSGVMEISINFRCVYSINWKLFSYTLLICKNEIKLLDTEVSIPNKLVFSVSMRSPEKRDAVRYTFHHLLAIAHILSLNFTHRHNHLESHLCLGIKSLYHDGYKFTFFSCYHHKLTTLIVKCVHWQDKD